MRISIHALGGTMRDFHLGRIRSAFGWSGLALLLAAASPIVSLGRARDITGIHAFLFNSLTGGWSRDIARGEVDLGNVGASPYNSSSTFVVVDVEAGHGPAFGDDAKVRLIAVHGSSLINSRRANSRVVLDAVQRVYGNVDHSLSHLGFWLPQNGCSTVTLTATLAADGKTYTRKQSLGFICSE